MRYNFFGIFNAMNPEKPFCPVRKNVLLSSIRKKESKRIVVGNSGDPDTEFTRDFLRFRVFVFRKID